MARLLALVVLLCHQLVLALNALEAHRIPSTLRSKLLQIDSVSSAVSKELEKLYPAHSFPVPINHFPENAKYAPHVEGTFPLRYWYNGDYYKPGGPVIVGKTDQYLGTLMEDRTDERSTKR